MNANDHLNRLIPLMDKLGEQVENVVMKPEGISLIEKELLKDTLKRLFETADGLPVVSVLDAPANTHQHETVMPSPVPSNKTNTVAASVLSTLKDFVAQQDQPEPEPVHTPEVNHQTIVQDADGSFIQQEVSAILQPFNKMPAQTAGNENVEPVAAEVSVIETTPAMTSVEAVVNLTPQVKSPVEEKVVETRAKHLYAAAQFEEQATVAAKYSAPETLGDKVMGNAAPRRVADQLQAAPLADLKTSIGINERFAFINELFGGDQQLYFQSLDRIHLFQSYDDAKSYLRDELSSHLNWSARPERARQFDELVKRRFHA